jgi:predicted ArsR family transcriptional regulator
MALLLNIARGRTVIYERKQICFDDLPLLADIALSSCPNNRGRTMKALLKRKTFTLSTSEIRKILNVGENTTLRLMHDLITLGVVEYVVDENRKIGRPEKMIKIHHDLEWIKKPEAKELFSKIADDD